MVNILGSQGLHPRHQPLVIENNSLRARRPRRWLIRRRAHRANHARAGMTRKLDRAHSDSASGPLYQHRSPRYCSRDMHSAMGRDAGYPQTSALIRRHALR
jgi:hypothetical protein